eukprot:922332-Amorphochlora_amoeboformis.AAC.1
MTSSDHHMCTHDHMHVAEYLRTKLVIPNGQQPTWTTTLLPTRVHFQAYYRWAGPYYRPAGPLH